MAFRPWMAYFNILRSLFGAGVLAMPMAISQTGLILGPILTLLTGLLVTHTHLLLLRCLNDVSRQLRVPYISYRYGFRAALLHGPPWCQYIGERGPVLVATFMILSQLGICVVFVTMTSDSLRDIMEWPSSRPAIIALFIPYLALEYGMKTLKTISYVSLLANACNVAGLIIVFYHIFKCPHGELMLANFEPIPLFFSFGTILFNLSAVGVTLSLDKALANPRVMTSRYGVIRVGVLVPTVVGTIFGDAGYWSFGTMEENVLRSMPFDDITTMICIGFYLVAVAMSYPIQCYPAMQVIREVIQNHDPNYTPTEAKLQFIESIMRPVFVCLSFIICYCVPFQGPFVAFVGNLCTTVLALVFPALMDISLRHPDAYGPYDIILIKNIVIIILGALCWCCGLFFCAYLIYIRLKSLRARNSPGFFR